MEHLGRDHAVEQIADRIDEFTIQRHRCGDGDRVGESCQPYDSVAICICPRDRQMDAYCIRLKIRSEAVAENEQRAKNDHGIDYYLEARRLCPECCEQLRHPLPYRSSSANGLRDYDQIRNDEQDKNDWQIEK